MPYRHDARLEIRRDDRRAEIVARDIDVAGEIADRGDDDDLSRWLVERYVNYGRLPTGRLWSASIAHEPWRLRRIDVERAHVPGLRGLPERAHAGQDVFVDLLAARLESSRQ
jgi:uncharacterized protein YqjF (DUF2071 family)